MHGNGREGVILEAEVLLFDLDGTLVDSSASVARAWRAWCARRGVDPQRLLAVSDGRQGHAVIAEFTPGLDAKEEDAWLIETQLHDTADVVAVEGAADLLAGLDPAGWAIVTSCPRALAEARLAAARLPEPRRMVCAEDITRSKPHPDGYLHAASELGVWPHACLVFEDSAAGLKAAWAAGMPTVAVTTAAGHALPAGLAVRDFRSVRVEGGQPARVRIFPVAEGAEAGAISV